MVGLASVAALSVFYVRLFEIIPRNSDNASAYLEGIDVWRGNVLLKGWVLPPNNFLTSDLALYGLIGRITGSDPAGLYYCPAILWALVVVLSAVAAVRGLAAERRLVALGTVATLVGLPLSLIGMLSDAPLHVGTISFMLISFLMVAALFEQHATNRALLAGYMAILAVATFGDPMMIVLGALPAAVVALYYSWLDPARRRQHLTIAAAAVVGAVAGKALLVIVQHYGFRSPRLDVGLVHLADIGRNLGWGAHAAVVLFGSELSFAGWTWNSQTVARLLRIPFIAIAAVVLGLFAWRIIAPLLRTFMARVQADIPRDYLNVLLAVAAGVNIASFCASRMILDGGSTRYVLPGFVFLVILMARRLAGSRLFAVQTGLALLTSLVVAAHAVKAAPPTPALATDDLKKVAAWLDAKGLKDGYSQFWSSNIITVLTAGRVKVRAVFGDESIVPYLWHANRNWYRPSDLRGERLFVLRLREGGPDELSLIAVRTTFGEPVQTETVGPYLVEIFERNDTRLRMFEPQL